MTGSRAEPPGGGDQARSRRAHNLIDQSALGRSLGSSELGDGLFGYLKAVAMQTNG